MGMSQRTGIDRAGHRGYPPGMAFIQCSFFSRVLQLSTSMYVVLPQREDPRDTTPYRTLFLLHGLSDDHTIWTRRTSIERYADARGIAVVMPGVGRSFYVDMACGPAFGRFAGEELPAAARALFPLSTRSEDTFIAGLSMGGYGAFRIALANPGSFAAAGSFSGALDVAAMRYDDDPVRRAEWERIFGDLSKIEGSQNDLFALARRMSGSKHSGLRLYQCCGTEDFLYQANVKFRDFARSIGLDLTYEEEPGIHEWGYWDRKVRDFLAWLP